MTTLGKPFTPSKIRDMSYTQALKITMSCGGGMGGSRWEEYVYIPDKAIKEGLFKEIQQDKFIRFYDYKNELKFINTKYIVKVEETNIAKLVVVNLGNSSYGSVGAIHNFVYLIDDNEPNFIDEFSSNDKGAELLYRN